MSYILCFVSIICTYIILWLLLEDYDLYGALWYSGTALFVHYLFWGQPNE